MSGELLRSELIKIHNLLVSKLVIDDLKWLKKWRGKHWENTFEINNLFIKSDSDPFYLSKVDISCLIQDMIDSKLRRTLRTQEDGKLQDRRQLHYKGELTAGRIKEIAIIFGVLEGPSRNKWQILGRINELQ